MYVARTTTGDRRRQRRRQQPDTRQEILEVALELFSQQGYEGTTLRQVAEEMGFSVAAIYYHFKAKDDLLSTLAHPYFDDLEAVISDAEAAAPLDADATRQLFDRYLDLLLANNRLTHFLEQDLGVHAHPHGVRLDELTERLRICLAGADAETSDLVRASAALGALRRPVLRLAHLDLAPLRQQLLDQALMVLHPGAPRAAGGQGRT